MIQDMEAFIRYFHGQRRRTQWVVDAIPPEKSGWRPWPGEPSAAEIVCRIAAGHFMYATAIAYDYWAVDDYENEAKTWEGALAYFHRRTEEALDLLRQLPNSVLQEKRHMPGESFPVSAWRFAMTMLDHEIAHRAQLNAYLMLLNARRPNMAYISIESIRAALAQP